MAYVIWGGALVALLGVLGLLGSGVAAMRARGAGLEDTALRARLQRILIWNMAALAVAMLGMMSVVVGLFLR
jgi:hypothetical protein